MPKNNEFANEVNNSNHVCTSAHDTGKENSFKGVEAKGYLPLEIEMNPHYTYAVVNAVGNCLDSDLSPIRVKDGDKLLVHSIPLTKDEIKTTLRK